MSHDSTIYTMGTALNRARDQSIKVAVLVEGQWISGYVGGVDGHGVILACADDEHAVVSIDKIAAVRLMTVAPHQAGPVGAPHAHEGQRGRFGEPQIHALH